MQRILDPAQIEAFTERSIPRVRLPDPASLFAGRAQRLRSLTENHSLGDYLRLMAALADAQQVQFDQLRAALISEKFAQNIGQQLELAHTHRMPVLQAAGWPRQDRWREILKGLCSALAGEQPREGAPRAVVRGFPAAVYALCARIVGSRDADLDAQADLLIEAGRSPGRFEGVDAQAAPFVMAALQVYWAAMVSTLQVSDVAQLDVPTVCPACGTLPVASIVRSDKRSPQGYRYLHCGLCETEWHMVRITCSHCLTTEGITYHSIEGASEAVRAETCGKCHTYRKILYQEKNSDVEPVADDLSSLALDLLMTEEGFHRGSGNPLLWQNSET
jgi:FdhE protein